MDRKSGSDTGRPGNGKKEQGYVRKEQSDKGKPYKKTADTGKRTFGQRDSESGGKPPYKKTEDRKPFGRDKNRDNQEGATGRDSARPSARGEGGYRKEGGETSYKKPYPKQEDRKPYSRDKGHEGSGRKPYELKSARPAGGGSSFGSDNGDKPYKKPFPKQEDRKPYSRDRKEDSNSAGAPRPYPKKERTWGDNENKGDSNENTGYGSKKPYAKTGERKPFEKDRNKRDAAGKSENKPFRERDKKAAGTDKERPFKRKNKEGFTPRIEDKYDKKDKKPTFNNPFRDGDKEKPARKRVEISDDKRPFKQDNDGLTFIPSERRKAKPELEAEPLPPKKRKRKDDDWEDEEDEAAAKKGKSDAPEVMPLNKYLAHAGVCGRREAVDIVKEGKVKVNNTVVTEPGYKVQPDDVVTMNEKKLGLQKGMVYILLNKPKDYITTTDDPQGRRTVMDLLEGAEAERLFPVGRLDRQTTGLLLITNDGDLTQKMAHPAYQIKKIYQVTLDKPLTKADAEKIVAGVELEDGTAHVDTLAYLETKNELGLEIHTGKNRIVRRIFESLGYEVVKLDRVMYAGLTKKNVPRGRWRYLTEREVVLLKHFKS